METQDPVILAERENDRRTTGVGCRRQKFDYRAWKHPDEFLKALDDYSLDDTEKQIIADIQVYLIEDSMVWTPLHRMVKRLLNRMDERMREHQNIPEGRADAIEQRFPIDSEGGHCD